MNTLTPCIFHQCLFNPSFLFFPLPCLTFGHVFFLSVSHFGFSVLPFQFLYFFPELFHSFLPFILLYLFYSFSFPSFFCLFSFLFPLQRSMGKTGSSGRGRGAGYIMRGLIDTSDEMIIGPDPSKPKNMSTLTAKENKVT